MNIIDKNYNKFRFKIINYMGKNIIKGKFEFSLIPTLIYKYGETYTISRDTNFKAKGYRTDRTGELSLNWLFFIVLLRFNLKDIPVDIK